jgi:hypothetical protein
MPIQSTKPTIVNGVEYPFFLITLSISPFDEPHGASVSLRLTPYRDAKNGQIEKLSEHEKSVSILDIFEIAQTDKAFENAIKGIMKTLQLFIIEKEL